MTTTRFAILGTARIARTLAPRIQASEGAQLVGVASRTPQNADAFAAEFAIPRTYHSYQAALDDPQIDAVYLPLPPSLHLEWTTKAAAAGKHVLCEKPLARNAAEVQKMTKVCADHHVVLMDGVMWYHTPRNAAIRQLVSDGQLGTLRQLNAVFTFCWDEIPMGNLRMHRELGGGSLLDLGWYCIGAALMLFGELPHEVFARAEWMNDVDTQLNTLLWFPENKVASIECGFHTVRRRWFELAGSRQTLFCDDFTRPWDSQQPGYRTLDNDGVRNDYVVQHKPQEECMVEAFCQLIRNQAYQHPLLKLAHQTQIVCDAVDKSARDGKPVRLT